MIAAHLVMVVEYGRNQFLTILKDAQDIDPVQFKAEFQDISDQLWQNLPAHRREAAHQDFMTQAKKALGWDQRPSQDTRPSQATPNPHPDTKGATRPHSSQETRPIPAEGQSTAGPVAAQSASTGSEAPEPTQSSGSSTTPESDSALERYDVQRNPHTGDAYLYDANSRDLVRTADGTPATIGDVSMPVTENDVKATQHRDQVMSDVLARIRDNKILKPGEAEEIMRKVGETYPYAPDIQENIDYMLKSHQTTISKDAKDFSADSFERIHHQLKDPSFQAKYEQNKKVLDSIARSYEGGIPKYIKDRGQTVETMDEAAISVLKTIGQIQEHEANTVKDITHTQKSEQLGKNLNDGLVEFQRRVDEFGDFINLPYPDSALGMETKFKAAESAGQQRNEMLIDASLLVGGGVAGKFLGGILKRGLMASGRSAATAEITGIGAGVAASGSVTAADVFNAYRTSIQDSYTKTLQSVKNPDGSILDLSNVAVRQRVLAENPDIRKKAAQAASMNALATLLGDRIGAFSGTIAKVIKPEISEIIKFGLETGASNSSQKAFEGLTKRPDK